jgi:ferritin-like protein
VLWLLLQGRQRRRRLLPVTARALAARVWTNRRRVELEAATRFRLLSTALAEHGSSETIVSLAREAAADELRHADRCATLVEHFGGDPPPTLAAPPTVPRVAPAGLPARDALLFEIVALSCVTETLSTALLGALVDAARDSLAKETMHGILRDEVRHSRLGWAHLAEAHASGAPDVVSAHLPAMLATTLGTDLFDPTPPNATDELLSGYGALTRPESLRVTRDCFHHVVFPGLERFGIDTAGGKRWLASRLTA